MITREQNYGSCYKVKFATALDPLVIQIKSGGGQITDLNLGYIINKNYYKYLITPFQINNLSSLGIRKQPACFVP